ncbi:MAG: argininosuccinate lyase, partial [Dehalococcoidales bacterium]|nr:argininosuccinate lyase [Dehalococcoidales bacterium]
MSNTRGRFSKSADKLAEQYTASLAFDQRLYKQDIAGSIAHVNMLAKQSIISDDEAKTIIAGLEDVRKEIEKGKFKFAAEQEDIHMAIEARLIEKVGEAGRKLHTARSRNDQVALDVRLFTKEAIADTQKGIRGLQQALLDLAEDNKSVVM